MTTSTLLFCQHRFTFPTFPPLFYCLAYPATTFFLFLFILIIFLEKWLLKRISFRLRLKTWHSYRTIIHFINIRLFNRIFYSFTRNLLPGVMIKILCFQYDLVRVKALAYIIRVIPAIILFFKIMFASIISWLKMCKKRATKTRKAKDVTGNDRKLILCSKSFGNYMKY